VQARSGRLRFAKRKYRVANLRKREVILLKWTAKNPAFGGAKNSQCKSAKPMDLKQKIFRRLSRPKQIGPKEGPIAKIAS
jgi:hypothetical protein